MQKINAAALIRVKAARPHLTAFQYRTLKGQVLAGDDAGALKGLEKILKRHEAAAERGGAR